MAVCGFFIKKDLFGVPLAYGLESLQATCKAQQTYGLEPLQAKCKAWQAY